jgi:hypothetical protein
MDDRSKVLENRQIEVSGWGLNGEFFVEMTDMLWTLDRDDKSQQKLLLHRSLSEGAVVFIRLFSSKSSANLLPVPYCVEGAEPMDCNGRCEVGIVKLYPRIKAPIGGQRASNLDKSLIGIHETGERSTQLELEEMLHEA